MAEQPLHVRLESDEFSCEGMQIQRVRGHEAISSPFEFHVDVLCAHGVELDLAAIEGATARLVFSHGDQVVRHIHGMIAEIDDHLDTEVDARHLVLLLVPRAHRLTLVRTQEAHVDSSVPDLLRKKLDLVGLAGADDLDLRLNGEYPERPFVVQYKESDLAFVSRLAEHLGISYFFEHGGGADKLVFADHAAAFHPNERAHVAFDGRGAKRGVHHLHAKTRLVPKNHIQHDYNYRTPHVDVSGSAEAPCGIGGGVVEYGSHAATPGEAARLAKIRAEEHEAAHRVFTGKASLPELVPGATFRLEDHRHLGDVDLLVTRVEHEATQASGLHGGKGDNSYVATFHAIESKLTYRPPRKTPVPRIHGVVTAIVEPEAAGDASRFAKIDQHGRYTVRFLFDAGEHGSHRPSLPVRMLQPHAGPGYGMHFPLKPGVEVLVAFLDGDPDRPFVVGAAPNPQNPSPVTRQSASTHRIRTETGILIELKDG